jgi:hypothetical protein
MIISELFKGIKPAEFDKRFSSQEQCLEFLSCKKWSDGFTCRKCGNTNYCTGKTPFSRRCTRCKHEESATAHTIFHRCKIHLPEAFRIIRMVCCKPEVSTYKISDQVDLRQMTCWKFKKKVTECLQTNKSLFQTESAEKPKRSSASPKQKTK